MTLFNIAVKNIRHNFKQYMVYLLSLSFAVVVFNLFLSVFMDDKVQKLISESNNYQSVFKVSAIVVAVFSIIFIWYSNSFFIKSRKKEIGLYSLLGVKQGRIGRMMFYETLLLGAIAIAIGSLVGVIFSRYFSMLLLKIMRLRSNISYSFNLKPILITIAVFIILFIIASIHGYSLIFRYRLIELFKADKKSGKIKKPSLIVSVLSLLLIGYAYYIGLTSSSEEFIRESIILIVCLISGTILLFTSFFVYFVYSLQKNKSYYYKNLNVFSISQIVYRIKGNAITLSIVAISISLSVFAATFTYLSYENTKAMTYERSPYSFMYKRSTEDIDNKVIELINQDKSHNILENFKVNAIGAAVAMEGFQDRFVYILDESTMNKILKHHNKQEISLKDNNSIYVIEFLKNPSGSSHTGKSAAIKTKAQEKAGLTVQGYDSFRLLNEGGALWNYVVVADEAYKAFYAESEKELNSFKALEVSDKLDTKALSEEINKTVGEKGKLDSYYFKYEEVLKSNAMMLFIGGFLSILFLMATGSILYFKQLMDANSDSETYKILSKIGVTEDVIKKSLFKQIAFIFIAPLAVGIMHSVALLRVMKTFVTTEVSFSLFAGVVIGIFTVLYLCYYYLTTKSYLRIVTES